MSNCIWYKIWEQYINGDIDLDELEAQTANEQTSIQYET